MTDQTKTATLAAPRAAAATDLAALGLAAVMGLSLLFVAGFAHGATAHDLAHDQRHALAFPCH